MNTSQLNIDIKEEQKIINLDLEKNDVINIDKKVD